MDANSSTDTVKRGTMLREKIQAETVTAMKAKDKERIAALRLIGAKIKDRDIELRTSDKKPEDDAMVTDVLLKMAKQRRESIEMYEAGGRQELADKEKAELATIEAAPEELWVRGEIERLEERPRVAIVGSRSPTPYGLDQAERFAARLAGRGSAS
jgi:uncharacterized protein YqeY